MLKVQNNHRFVEKHQSFCFE